MWYTTVETQYAKLWDRFQPGLKWSLLSLAWLHFGQDSQAGMLVKEGWEPPVFLWTNMNEPALERFMVASIPLIFHIQKTQFSIVIIHLLLSFSFCDLFGQCLSNNYIYFSNCLTWSLSRWMSLMEIRSTRNRISCISKHRNEIIFYRIKTCKHPRIQGVLAVWITVCLLIQKKTCEMIATLTKM